MTRLLPAVLVILTTASLSASAAETGRSDRVERYLRDAGAAMEQLAAGDLAAMEAALEPGFAEIEAMLATYPRNESSSARTNAYLRERGWGHLVWTQIMVRLMAIRDGAYEHELAFAERVPLERVARASLATLDQSSSRIEVLMRAKDRFGFGAEVDAFARGLFPEGDTDYRVLVADHRAVFQQRRGDVVARLESGRRPPIVDPASLPSGTRYAAAWETHQERLNSDETRLDEILVQLASYDPVRVERLVATGGESLDAARVELLLFEDALCASEADPVVHRMIDLYEEKGAAAFEAHASTDVDFRDTMKLLDAAQRVLDDHADPQSLRGFYELADLAR